MYPSEHSTSSVQSNTDRPFGAEGNARLVVRRPMSSVSTSATEASASSSEGEEELPPPSPPKEQAVYQNVVASASRRSSSESLPDYPPPPLPPKQDNYPPTRLGRKKHEPIITIDILSSEKLFISPKRFLIVFLLPLPSSGLTPPPPAP